MAFFFQLLLIVTAELLILVETLNTLDDISPEQEMNNKTAHFLLTFFNNY